MLVSPQSHRSAPVDVTPALIVRCVLLGAYALVVTLSFLGLLNPARHVAILQLVCLLIARAVAAAYEYAREGVGPGP